jgi:ABC-type transporter Mla subunit MlaD
MSPSGAKARRRLGGVAFLLVLALLVWLSIALYQKKFTPVAMVTLYTSSAGNEMHPGAQVMVRGVQVGEVRQNSPSTRTSCQCCPRTSPRRCCRLPCSASATWP